MFRLSHSACLSYLTCRRADMLWVTCSDEAKGKGKTSSNLSPAEAHIAAAAARASGGIQQEPLRWCVTCIYYLLEKYVNTEQVFSKFKNGITAYYWSFCGAVTVRKPSRFGNGALIHLTSTDASTWHAPWCIFSILWKQTRACSYDATNTAHCIPQRGTMTDVSSKVLNTSEHIWTHLNCWLNSFNLGFKRKFTVTSLHLTMGSCEALRGWPLGLGTFVNPACRGRGGAHHVIHVIQWLYE